MISGILAMVMVPMPGHAEEFSYNGDKGPGYWSELSPAWAACAASRPHARQSPINIAKVFADDTLGALDLRTFPTTIDIFNNGHTIEQRYEGTGSSVDFEGRNFELQQFHFHTLSEHSVSGKHAAMEMHGVFTDSAVGDNLVIGILFRIGGNGNAFLQKLIDARLPQKEGDATQTSELIDFGDGLTNRRQYYTYPGSLTTPPCSETVTWVVLARPAEVSRDQYEAFRRILGNNFRPTQVLNERTVRATQQAVVPKGL
jgi:carbonic anhydrase